MLTQADLIYLAYSDEYTRAGVTMACRSLSRHLNIRDNFPYSHIHKIVSNTVVELAFRRFLVENHIPHKVVNTSPFSAPERSEVILLGRRSILRTTLVNKKKSILSLHHHPNRLLQSRAVIEGKLLYSEKNKDTDFIIFAVLTGLISSNPLQIKRAYSSQQPIYLIYNLPRVWSNPNHYGQVDKLTFAGETNEPITLELVGENIQREFQTIQIEIHPHQRTTISENLYSFAYLHVNHPLNRIIQFHSSRLGRKCVIKPHEWQNIWVYGMKIILVGYMTYEELRQRIPFLKLNRDYHLTNRTNPYYSGVERIFLNIHEFHPLTPLFEQALLWKTSQKINN